MRRFTRHLTAFAGMFLAFYATASCSSNLEKYEDKIDNIRAMGIDLQEILHHPVPKQTSASAWELPFDVRNYILSFVQTQNDFLRIGGISKSWRTAAAKVWETRVLDLSNKSLTFTDLSALARGIFSHIKIDKTGLKDEGARTLSSSPFIKTLEMRENHITMAGFKALLTLPSLTSIDLYNSSIGTPGPKAYAEMFMKNPLLSQFCCSMSTNKEMIFGNSASTSPSFAFGNSFGRSGNPFREEDPTFSPPFAPNITSPSIFMPGSLCTPNVVQDEKITIPPDLPLTQLHLAKNNISDKEIEILVQVIKNSPFLTKIDLYNNEIGAEGSKALALALKDTQSLKTINVGYNNIGSEGAKSFVAAIQANISLEALDLSDCNIGDEGIKALAFAIQESKCLTSIDLKGNGIKQEGAKALASALKGMSSLTRLNLSRNHIDDEGAKSLVAVFKENISLVEMNLLSNCIMDEGKKVLEDPKRSRPSLKLYY